MEGLYLISMVHLTYTDVNGTRLVGNYDLTMLCQCQIIISVIVPVKRSSLFLYHLHLSLQPAVCVSAELLTSPSQYDWKLPAREDSHHTDLTGGYYPGTPAVFLKFFVTI